MGPPAAKSSSSSSLGSKSNNSDNNSDRTTSSAAGNINTDNNTNSSRSTLKRSADSDLKSSVIEFMKARPFLWNKRQPGYKDHKKRDHEFQEYSAKIGYSVQEIKRVWHVLRTNFFRAHKILSDKPGGNGGGNSITNASHGSRGKTGERLWKYYNAMLYILEGSIVESTSRKPIATTSRGNGGGNFTNSQLVVVEQRANSNTTGRRVSNRVANTNNVSYSATKDTNGVAAGGNEPSYTNKTVTMINNGLPITSADTSSANTPTSKLSTFNESLLDEDDDFLYARSLSLTLKKFDPTTKEIVKLKFQEIIVETMQQRQQQQQQQQPQQLSQLEPPPPSEIANMEASLANNKKPLPANEVT